MSLQNLSDKDFEISLRDIVQRERQVLHLLLIHLAEADRRRLYADKGRSSLFEYLVKDFGYSESAALRRIQAARLSLHVPSLPEKLKSGTINLAQVGELSRALRQVKAVSPERKQELVELVSGQGVAATQRILTKELDIQLKPPEKICIQKDESVSVQLTLNKAQYEKLLRCKDFVAATLMKQGKTHELANVIEVMSDKVLEQPEPKNATEDLPRQSVTRKIRRHILKRDKSCRFKYPDGHICGSTFNLQIDHIKPRWAGGGHELENLQVLCATHNRQRYRIQAGFS